MPKPKIQWFHNQQLMLPTKDIVFHFDESTGTAILIIVDAFLEHAGQYSCKARNSAGETTCTATLTVTAEVQALDRQSSGKDVKESIRSQAISELHVAPLTKKNIKTYQKEFKTVQQPPQQLGVQVFERVSESLTMKATSVEEMEAMHTTVLSQTSQSTRISVATAQEMNVPPKILLQLKDLTVKCGDTAQFVCGLESEFFSEFLWAHEGETIEGSEKLKISQNGSVLLLTILNAQLTDQGLYSCTVYNDYGGTTTAAMLTVKGGYLTFNIMTYLLQLHYHCLQLTHISFTISI
ncbi:peroxidasin-like [Larus michahellis]|uniref:peroxidasin-like n=1 Tax=Larus michahellis TaxID=119627 RepID=UPI003D9ADBA2